MNDYSFADYAKAEHADLRQLILAQARAGKFTADTSRASMTTHEREQFRLWEKDLVTLLEVLEERDYWKERFNVLRGLFESLLETHRKCSATCTTCHSRR